MSNTIIAATSIPSSRTRLGADRTGTCNVTNASVTVTFATALPTLYRGKGGFLISLNSTILYVSHVAADGTSLLLTTNYTGSTDAAAAYRIYPVLELRWYADTDFTPFGSSQIIQESAVDSQHFYGSKLISQYNGGTGDALWLPELTIPATTDIATPAQQRARWRFVIYELPNKRIDYLYGMDQGTIIPASPSSTDWTAILRENQAQVSRYNNKASTLSATQIAEAIAAASTISGTTRQILMKTSGGSAAGDSSLAQDVSGNISTPNSLSLGTDLSVGNDITAGGDLIGAVPEAALASFPTANATNERRSYKRTDGNQDIYDCVKDGSVYAWRSRGGNGRYDLWNFGATQDASTNDKTKIDTAIGRASAGGEILFSNIAAVNATVTQPNRVSFRGQNVRLSGLKAISAFTGSYVVNAVNGTSSLFDAFIEKMTINANDIAGLGGILSDAYQENSGVRNVLIQKFRTYGILYQNGYGGAATNLIDGAELFASSSGATAGIRVEQISLVGNFVLSIQNSVVTGDTVNLPRGIDIVNDSTVITNVHFEVADNGVYLDGVGDHILIGVTGATTVTTLVRIASTFTGTLTMLGCKRGGATNFIVDERAGGFGTIASEDIANFRIGKTRIDALGASRIVTTDSSRNLATNGNLTYNGNTLFNVGEYAGTGTIGLGISYARTVADNTALLRLVDSPSASNGQGLLVGIDTNGGSIGFSSGGGFVSVGKSGTGTARPLYLHNYDSQPIGFITNNLLRGQFTSAGLFALGDGATSSYPALKRNATSIDFRLADDSGYAGIAAQTLALASGTTATASAGAATANTQTGVITSEALTTAAGAAYTLTLTNSMIAATSKVFITFSNGTNSAGTLSLGEVTPGSGSAIIVIRNIHAADALNGTIKITFFVIP